MWFTSEQIQLLEQDSSLIREIIISDVDLVVWEGYPDSFVKELMNQKDLTWIPLYPNGFFTRLDSQEATQAFISQTSSFKEQWWQAIASQNGTLGGVIASSYPFLQDQISLENMVTVLRQDQDLIVLLRPGQVPSLNGLGQVMLTCLDEEPSVCSGNRLDLSRTTSSQELLENLSHFSQGFSKLYTDAEVLIHGVQWLDMLQTHPDYSYLIRDLRQGHETVFPTLYSEKFESFSLFATVQHILTIILLIGYLLLIRSSGYYLQRLYRYVLNFGFVQLEISSRKDHSIFESLGYFLLGSLLSGLLLNMWLHTQFSPVGMESLQQIIPVISIGGNTPLNSLPFSVLVAMGYTLLMCLWVWMSYSRIISFSLVLKTCTWPLHILMIPFVFLLRQDPAHSSGIGSIWSVGVLLFLLLVFILSNVNLYQVPRRKKGIWLGIGIFGWILFLALLLFPLLFYSGLSEWVRFASSL